MHSNSKTIIHITQAVIAIMPIVLGAFIYIAWRPSEPLFIEWFSLMGFEGILDWIHSRFNDSQIRIPDWIIFSLPSGFWAFAYSFIIVRIWNLNNSKVGVFWIATIPVFIFGLEVLQLTSFMHGIFSFLDMIFSAIGMLAGYIVAMKLNELEIKQ